MRVIPSEIMYTLNKIGYLNEPFSTTTMQLQENQYQLNSNSIKVFF